MTDIPIFKLEEFWKKYEFSAPYLLCPSDAETWLLKDIIAMADSESKSLWDNLSLGYTESPGLPILRKEIARLYNSLEADHILTTAGAEEGIYCAMHSLISQGDHVIVVSPSYQSLETLPQVLGAEITFIHLQSANKWKLSFDQIQSVWRPSTKLLILVCPHNPTGILLEADVYEKMISLARKTGAYIFCDEVYRFLEIDESKRLTAIADGYEKGISLNVMTKSFGLAGLRIGWLASKDVDFLQKANSYKMYTSICNSAPSEVLALIALRSKNEILKRNREIVLQNIELLDEFVKRHPESIRWVRPESGTIAFLELLLPISIDQFTEQLVEKTGVLIMPATIFDCPGNFFRIGFGRSNMSDVLKRFEQFLSTYENLYKK
jgi:aspartate/methionine/tyrosine aminotransferase